MDSKTALELRAMLGTPQAADAIEELCRRAEVTEAAVAAAAARPSAFAARNLYSCAVEARVGMRSCVRR